MEKQIEKAIVNFIKFQGGFAVPIQSGAIPQVYKGKKRMIRMCPAGTPDVIGCLNGKFLGIEVKKNEKEVEKWIAYPLGLRGKPVKYNKRIEAQQRVGKEIRESGGFFAVVCSVDELESDLKSFGVIK